MSFFLPATSSKISAIDCSRQVQSQHPRTTGDVCGSVYVSPSLSVPHSTSDASATKRGMSFVLLKDVLIQSKSQIPVQTPSTEVVLGHPPPATAHHGVPVQTPSTEAVFGRFLPLPLHTTGSVALRVDAASQTILTTCVIGNPRMGEPGRPAAVVPLHSDIFHWATMARYSLCCRSRGARRFESRTMLLNLIRERCDGWKLQRKSRKAATHSGCRPCKKSSKYAPIRSVIAKRVPDHGERLARRMYPPNP
jgi:hypothetical protein